METLSQEAQYKLMRVMAQRATVATVRGDRGQADWRRGDQPASARGRSHPKNDPQRTRRTEGRSAGALYQPGERIRQQGGGRKKRTAQDATLRADLEEMLDPKGDPESLVRWTSKSVSKLREALTRQGHTIGETAIRRMLHEMGFSLKANKKGIEGASHADRDAQFQHINRTGKAFEAKGKPAISVDWKKKELIGNAQEWRERMASQRARRDRECL